MDRINDIIKKNNLPSSITPLFWQHAEDEDTLRNEIRKMKSVNIDGFIVESRPHPDFVGDIWWRDMDIIIDEAKSQDMKVWIFDDNAYPSGFSAGLVRDNNPELLKIYLRQDNIDAIGPLKGSSVILNQWIALEETLVAVVAAKRIDMIDKIDSETLVDITSYVNNGMLYWDIPDGAWRIFIFVSTRHGGEEWTKDYINPLQKEAVAAYIDNIYKPHYDRYASEFGKTIAGFFTDEPRFGSCGSYEAVLGSIPMVIPYSNNLLENISSDWEEDFTKFLPLLWYDGGEITSNARYTYMNLVSRLFGQNFQQQIGDWCRNHNVKSIGHVVEDNGAHTRLGLGAGHFFRVIKGQDYSGFDIVYHVLPEYMDGKYKSPFGYLDAEFFYWGISKMAVSASHIEPNKNGITVCEIFGAYGWQEGLKLMKWLTDHICVRGVNFIIPHAFSPKYPDEDCPPHFYAQGNNPQWKDFNIWSNYANRVCHLLKDGVHRTDIAVLYHAEAEWAGQSQPFEKIVKQLAINQFDCEILPIDIFSDVENFELLNGSFRINKEIFKVLIIPFSEYLTKTFIEKVQILSENEVTVIFSKEYPKAALYNHTMDYEIIQKLKESPNVFCFETDNLSAELKKMDCADIEIEGNNKYLRHYHYDLDKNNIYMLTNESKFKVLDELIWFPNSDRVSLYDAMEDKFYIANSILKNRKTGINIVIEPYQSLFVIFGEVDANLEKRVTTNDLEEKEIIDGNWGVSTTLAKQYPDFKSEKRIRGLGNISTPDILPKFSGIIKYETSFDISEVNKNQVFLNLGEVYELATVFVNDKFVDTKICPPYLFNISDYIKKDENKLVVEVTNTFAKEKGENWLDRYMPQEPSGLIGPVRLMCKKYTE